MRQNTTIPLNQPFMVISSINDFERLENQGEDHGFLNFTPYSPDHLQNPLPQTIHRDKQQIDIPFFAKTVSTNTIKSDSLGTQTAHHFGSGSYFKCGPSQPCDRGSFYELQEEDIKFLEEFNKTHDNKLTEQLLEQAIQQLELNYHYEKFVTFRPGEGIDPGRNFQRQWELLSSYSLIPSEDVQAYWQLRTEKLDRSLLRVFMRAQENDSRAQIAFRPTRPYKQKRLKRLGMPLQEYEYIQKKFRNENLIALHTTKMLVHRESIKTDLLVMQKQLWLTMDENQSSQECSIDIIYQKTRELQDQAKDLTKQLKQLRLETQFQNQLSPLTKNKTEEDIIVPPSYMKFKECSIEDCQFNQFQNLTPTYLTSQLMDVMTDQFAEMKQKGCQVEWPDNPIVLRNMDDEYDQDTLVIRPKSLIGQYSVGNQMIIGSDLRTIILKQQDQQKKIKIKKSVNLTFIDTKTNRLSFVGAVKVDYDHFVHHSLQHQAIGLREVDAMKKLFKRNRLEILRQDRLIKLKILKKKRTDDLLTRKKNILKIRLKLEDLIIKTQPQENPRTPTHRPPKSRQVSANRIILRKFDFDKEQIDKIDDVRLSCIQQSPSKFRLICKVGSPTTFRLHLGQESHESGSLETHPRNIFNLSASKPIEDFNTKQETM